MSSLNTVQRCLPPLARLMPLQRKMNPIPSVLTKAHFWPLRPLSPIKQSKSRTLAGALLKVASHPTPSPFLLTHRHGRVKIVLHGFSNSHCQHPQWRALLADSLPCREGMVLAAHRHLRGRYVMPIPSTISTKLRHFFPTLTSSPCLIMLHSMVQSGLKLWGCTFQSPSNNGSSRAPLVSMIVAILRSQAIAR